MAVLAYRRISNDELVLENQTLVIEAQAKIDKWFEDTISGATLASKRPGLSALMEYAREGDVIYVIGIDRLGRDTIDILSTIKVLIEKKTILKSLREGIDFNSIFGPMIAAIFASFAELERRTLIERTKAGIARAKAQGIPLGRPVIHPSKEIARWHHAHPSPSISQTAKHWHCSSRTVRRALKLYPAPQPFLVG